MIRNDLDLRRRLKRALMIIGTAIVGIAAVAAVTVAIGRATFKRHIAAEVEELLAKRNDARSTVLTETDLAALPEPVRRWLHYSGVVGKERPVTVHVRQTGQFRLGETQGWMPFTADQYYTTDPPGFVWVATFRMPFLLSIMGRDRYVDGTGGIDMRLLSLISVARKSGGSLNQGALLRYLNETMWFPAAAVSPYITWEAINTTSARATMAYGGVTGSAVFVFDDQGRIADMTAERYDDSKRRLLPWSTPITAYGEFAGVKIPGARGGQVEV